MSDRTVLVTGAAGGLGRAFALGEDAIGNPGTYSFDCNLNIWPDPLMWLRAKCDGCVILDWRRAWSCLQDAPRIAVHERLDFCTP